MIYFGSCSVVTKYSIVVTNKTSLFLLWQVLPLSDCSRNENSPSNNNMLPRPIDWEVKKEENEDYQ